MNRLNYFVLPLLLALGCSGGGGTNATMTGGNGTLTLALGSDSQTDWSEIVVGVEKVEVSTNGTTWSTIATPQTTGNLMALQNGFEKTLANKVILAAGTYTVRVTWATTNYADISRREAYAVSPSSAVSLLTMPPTTTFQGSIQVTSSAESLGFLMIDAARALQSYPKLGGGTEVLFQPHPELIPAATSGDIEGQVMAAGLVGAGQEVLAEVVDGALVPRVRRRATTDSNGYFLMRGLPVGQVYLVCMPTGTTPNTVFPALGLGPITTLAGGSVRNQNFAFMAGSAQAIGDLQLTVSPVSARGITTYADLRQNIPVFAGSAPLVVREGVVSTGATSDQRLFKGLPIGSFGANATRLSTPTATTPAAGLSLVTAGGTTATTLVFP
ncbi:MAG: DUF4382 domain-containing protein [Holophaga sp.]|nr:DUF4382 domain-containing protein [Holophaga sp.]